MTCHSIGTNNALLKGTSDQETPQIVGQETAQTIQSTLLNGCQTQNQWPKTKRRNCYKTFHKLPLARYSLQAITLADTKHHTHLQDILWAKTKWDTLLQATQP